MEMNAQIQQAAKLINRAKNMVAMTGAGISTPSGIPDFRSPNSGVWDTADPMTVASIYAFRQNPARFYAWIRPLARLFLQAQPNPAHLALVELERRGKLKAVITQNIDDLHNRAGSKTVYELHGHMRQFTCTRCYRLQMADGIVSNFVADGNLPACPDCGSVLKPNIILFGEQLPVQEFVSAQMAINATDLMLVAGSSLEVTPASDLPLTALAHGARLIIVNYQPTYLDSRADLVIRGDVATVLPQIVNALAG